MSRLLNYYATSYKNGTFCIQYGQPVPIVDEGPILRVNELQWIDKAQIKSVSIIENTAYIHYTNGEKVELGLIKK